MSTDLKKEIPSTIQNQDDIFSAGDWLYWKCEFEKAQKHFEVVLNRPSLTASDLARCYKSLSAVEVELKNYDKAIDLYNKQLDILQTICDSTSKNEDILKCYISIGKVYWLKSDYNQAIAYHHQAIEFAQSFKSSPIGVSDIYKNLANIYTSTKQFDLALEYFEKALQIDDKHLPKNDLQLGQTYANMGAMYLSKQNYKEALKHFEKARETFLKRIPSTHVTIEKIDKTIQKVNFKLTKTNLSSNLSTSINSTVENKSNVESSLDIQSINPLDILAQSNIMVLWLDDYIGRDENCRALKMEFRQITNSLRFVDSVDSCRECLQHVKNRKLFCIIQGKYAKEIVPDIVKIVSPSMKPIVYIFCLHMIYLNEWAQEQECIMEGGMFDHEKDLFERLNKDLKDYVKQKSVEYKTYLQLELISKVITQFTETCERCYKEKDTRISSNITIKHTNQNTPTVA